MPGRPEDGLEPRAGRLDCPCRAMLKARVRLQTALILLFAILLVAAAFILAYLIRSELLPRLLPTLWPRPLYPLGDYLGLLPMAIVSWMAPFLAYRHQRWHRADLKTESWEMVKVAVAATVLMLVGAFVLQLDQIVLGDRLSRTWLALFSALALALLLGHKVALRLISNDKHPNGTSHRSVLIAGAPAAAAELARAIQRNSHWGLRIAGIIHTEDGEIDDQRWPLLGSTDDLPRVVEREVVDDVFFAVPVRQLGELQDVLDTLQDQGISIRIALHKMPTPHSRIEFDSLGGRPILTVSPAPSNVLLLMAKRLIDLAVGGVLLVISLPLLILLGLLIKAGSRGPALYRQTRCGLNGRLFTMYKLRTMVANAETQRSELEHLNTMSRPAFKMLSDPRITRVGRVLRRFSLDELPQLWNVVRGDMSLVGPRPLEEKQGYTMKQRRRLSMKPGITCLWQVNGRSDLDFDRWMELDLEYVDTWSPALDLKILLRTIPAILSRRGAR